MGMTPGGDDAKPGDHLCSVVCKIVGAYKAHTGSVHTFNIDSMSRGSRAKKTSRVDEKDLIVCIWIPESWCTDKYKWLGK